MCEIDPANRTGRQSRKLTLHRRILRVILAHGTSIKKLDAEHRKARRKAGAQLRYLSADTFLADNPMAVMPTLYHPRETIAVMMAPVATFLVVMTMVVIRTAAGDNLYGGGLGWKA
jgi:hypothetical protein